MRHNRRMRPSFRHLLLTCILIGSSSGYPPVVSAQDAGVSPPAGGAERRDDPTAIRKTRGQVFTDRYYEDRERGWYWFEEDPNAQAPLPEVPAETPPPTNPHPPLSVEWLRIELEKARIEAIDTPTRENVEYYAYLEKLTLDKAERFAQVRMQLAMINPGLDETVENPVTNVARTARRDKTAAARSAVFKDLASRVGIYYFFRSDCPYCARQNPALAAFQADYGFSILPISIDGAGMPDGGFPNWVPDRGQAALLKIESTPTLYLVRPPNQVVILSVGTQALPNLESRILQVAKANDWISQEQFESAVRGGARNLLIDAMAGKDGINWSNKADALQALRELTQRGVPTSAIDALNLPESTPLSR
jgi:conjugal transfer pilus assembly protein TraF